MGHTKTTIEINGKIYDATTGALLHGNNSDSAPTYKKPASKGVVVDGFVRRPAAHTPTLIQPQPKATHHSPRQVAPQAGHSPQTSKTLMRHAVHKPTSQAPAIKSKASPVAAPAKEEVSNTQHTQQRHERASQISRSSSISRFGKQTTAHKVEKKYQPLAVKPHPEQHHTASHKPHHSKSADSFSTALQNATSHTEPVHKVSKRRHRAAKKLGISVRTVNIGAISLAVVLLVGFIAYQNVPNMSMRMASSRAGFHASLPGYTPSGFSLAGPIQSSPGNVTVSFRSNSDDRNFQVSQQPSNWTSESLLTNQVAVNDKSYEIYQDKGRTIYVYDDNTKATWVNGGVWYQLSNQASLSGDQIVSIADSL